MTATATRALGEVMRRMPLIAILRGVAPNEVADVAAVLVEHGVEIIEIPMNSPEPLASIGILADRFGDRQLIGCGTVTTAEELRAAHSVGARLVLHPMATPSSWPSPQSWG